MSTASIVFTPSGIRGEVSIGTDVLTAARKLGVDLDTSCGGNGQCGRCKVQITDGEYSKHQITAQPTHRSKPSSAEQASLSKEQIQLGFRLGCNTQILGDLVVDIPAESQVHQQVVRKAAATLRADAMSEAQAVVELITLEVAEPKLNSPSGDLERLRDAIEFETGYIDLEIESVVLRELQRALRKSNWEVTVAIYTQKRIIAIWPGEQNLAYGIAVDIGSTTIAGHLCDISQGTNHGAVISSSGMMNPQIRFGEDVMSRVSYSMMNKGGAEQMTTAVREGLNQLIDRLLDQAQTEGYQIERNQLLDITLVGNPIMHHLLLGIDPVELGGAPFALATQESIQISARDLELKLALGAQAYVLPCVAGHVGADAAAVALAEAPYKQSATTLIIDVGTNAEIILGNEERLVAASAPTGPAFEGAQITHGQRAAPGAIERVRVNKTTLAPRFKVIGSDLWSDDSKFNEDTKDIGVTGICGSGIIEAIATLFLAGVIQPDGVISGPKNKEEDDNVTKPSRVEKNGNTWAYRLSDDIIITQNDVRAIQLAKSTLYASAKLLMDKLGIKQLTRIRFAGAFGAHIDPKYAMLLGMIPDCPLDQVTSVGNAAGSGARIALLSHSARKEIETEVRRMEKIETATEPQFQDYFIGAMAIPHLNDSFPNLAEVIEIPSPTDSHSSGSRRKRRRSKRPKS